jgi:hypothetical protein
MRRLGGGVQRGGAHSGYSTLLRFHKHRDADAIREERHRVLTELGARNQRKMKILDFVTNDHA